MLWEFIANLKSGFPNLFIVGAPKCGTTSMYAYLKSHPEIFMSETKEINYFGKDLQWYNSKNRVLGDKKYMSHFADSDGYKIIGEASTIYIHSQMACDEIYDFNPSAKIIIMLRNPVDMIISMHSQLLFTGSENEKNLLRALMLEKSRMEMHNMPPLIDIANKLFYIHNVSTIKKNIALFYQRFGKQNVHLVLFDDMKKNPSIEYTKVLNFLGVDVQHKTDFIVYNKRKTYRYDFLRKFIRKFSPTLGSLRANFISKPIGIMKLLERVNSKKNQYTINEDTLKFIYHEIGDTINELEKYINRDLSHWKN